MLADQYLKVRKHIKSLCLDNVIELCERTGLTEQETELVKHINRGDTRVYIGMTMGMCESAVSKKAHKVFTKIRDYLRKNNIPY